MIDIHTHILPGVDDGVENLEEAIEIARDAQSQGITALIATPHYMMGRYQLETAEVKTRCQSLQQELLKAGIELEILPGHEVYLKSGIEKRLKENKVQSLNDSDYLLVELPMHKWESYVDDTLYNIKAMGYKVIIAHPERYRYVQQDPNLVYQWNRNGIAVQINSGSLLGIFGSRVQETAEKLLSNGLVQFVASDLHSNRMRNESLAEVMDLLADKLSEGELKRLRKNSGAIRENKELDFGNFTKYEVDKGMFKRLRLALGLLS